MKKSCRFAAAFLACLLALTGCGSSEETTRATYATSEEETTTAEETTEETTAAKTNVQQTPLYDIDFTMDSESCCVLSEDGEVWLGEDIYEEKAPASITKVLTALIVCEKMDLDETVTIEEDDLNVDVMSSGVEPSLKPGETMTIRDLLYAMILPSTNAAANVLARAVSGSVDVFVGQMNEKAESLGLKHSHFMNPSGLDEDDHYSCAYDMCVILKEACANEQLRTILGTMTYTIPATEYAEERIFTMGHDMVNGSNHISGVFAGKTGWTVNAQSTLLTGVVKNGKEFYICTMHSDNGCRYTDTENLIRKVDALSGGEETNTRILLHDFKASTVSSTQASVGFKVSNETANVRLVWFDAIKGSDTAKEQIFSDVSGDYSVTIDCPEASVYEVQIYVTGYDGQETAKGLKLLFTGGSLTPGMNTWNDNTYYVRDDGFLETGSIETEDGCYYADEQGALVKGMTDKGYFAGEDYKIVTGWFNYNGASYYAWPDGTLAKGTCLIEGLEFNFSENGVLVS